MKNIVLIGMPGSGKSTFGKQLASILGRPFYDADLVLEEREGRSIKDFFAESEASFRAAETRTLRFLCELNGVIIATGGGCVTREENMLLLARHATIVFLDREPMNIIEAIQGDERPLLAADKNRLFQLYEQRIDLYRRYANHVIDNNATFETTLTKLLQIAKKE